VRANGSTVAPRLQTEFPFVLPKGYVDREGNVHRDGTMRLATANDEIAPLRDPRVRQNEAYMTVIVLARVVTRLGTLSDVNPGVIESLFASKSDLLILPIQDVFGWRDRINEPATVGDSNWTFRLPWFSDRLNTVPEACERQAMLRTWAERHNRT